MTLGEKLRSIRTRMAGEIGQGGLSQEELSKRIGVTPTALSNIERNKRKHPISNDLLFKVIAVAKEFRLNVTINELRDDEVVPKCLKTEEKTSILKKRYTPECFNKVVKTLWDMRVRIGQRLNENGKWLYQCQLAEILGIHPSTVSNYHCKRRVPHRYVRRRLIDFACRYGIFLGNKDFVAYEIARKK